MLRFLFPRLTPAPELGADMFNAVTAEARRPHWYLEGGVPDDLDGRFRVLATIAALVMVRLEQLGAERETVALTERFVDVMEAEHRELGLGDPGLGKTVRRLVSALGRRVALWREATGAEKSWDAATRESLYAGAGAAEAPAHTAKSLRDVWGRLGALDAKAIAEGKFR